MRRKVSIYYNRPADIDGEFLPIACWLPGGLGTDVPPPLSSAAPPLLQRSRCGSACLEQNLRMKLAQGALPDSLRKETEDTLPN